jgi:hypothetical protein
MEVLPGQVENRGEQIEPQPLKWEYKKCIDICISAVIATFLKAPERKP